MENREQEAYYIRPESKRKKMARSERAKQFIPFAALKGYPQALAQKEKIVVEKIELSEERAEQLNWKMKQVKKRQVITVVYYSKGEYIKQTGMVSAIDLSARFLKIVNTKIAFEDIYDIFGNGIKAEEE